MCSLRFINKKTSSTAPRLLAMTWTYKLFYSDFESNNYVNLNIRAHLGLNLFIFAHDTLETRYLLDLLLLILLLLLLLFDYFFVVLLLSSSFPLSLSPLFTFAPSLWSLLSLFFLTYFQFFSVHFFHHISSLLEIIYTLWYHISITLGITSLQ